jgi:hypothetical protein
MAVSSGSLAGVYHYNLKAINEMRVNRGGQPQGL